MGINWKRIACASLAVFSICCSATDLNAYYHSKALMRNQVAMNDDQPTTKAKSSLVEKRNLPVEKRNLMEIIIATPSLATLTQAIMAVDLQLILNQPGPFTIFAPDNKAFENLPHGTMQKWLKPYYQEKLTAVLKYHIIPGTLTMADLQNPQVHIHTLNGKDVAIADKGNDVYINNSKVIKKEIRGSNGVIYIIDSVLVPEK